MTTKVDSREAMAFAMELADVARPIALKYFRTPMTVTSKSDGTPVTLADQAIEAELRRRIRERFPDHGIIGEETGGGRGERYTWIIDPIDGTRGFVSGCPLFGTMIGLLREDEAVFGLIDIPATGERWVGDGRETSFNGRKAHASDCASLAEARAYTTSIDIPAPADLERLNRVCSRVSFTRYSGDCYAYGLLASGHCDLVIDFGLDPYDYLPLVGVVTGAGGAITDWQTRSLCVQSDGRVVAAATQTLLDQAIRTLQEPD
jgi:inositol-phosphate phosphatase / L-galactose 1-phosphate phosphatase / histidinol-phosphatase